MWTFDSLPNAGSPTTTTVTTTTTVSSTTVTDHLVPKVIDMQDKLNEVEQVMEEQIKNNEAQVNTLKATIEQQDTTIEKLQGQLAEQADQFAAYMQKQDEQTALTEAKFAQLYKALSALSQPLPNVDADPDRKCAPGSSQPDTAIEVSGAAGSDRVLSLSVCDGKVELNSDRCTVDPCELQQYIQVLQSRLAALKDI